MLKAERLEIILRLCGEHGRVTVHQIAAALGVSEMTARRDCDELSRAGKVQRQRGGVTCCRVEGGSAQTEAPYFEKLSVHEREKYGIALEAAQIIEEHDTVFLGAGSTCAAIARALPDIAVRIITNSLLAFNVLRDSGGIEICVIGGASRSRSGSIVGPIAEEMVSAFGIDKCFIGANGARAGAAYTSNIEDGRVQALALNRSGARYLVVDSSKIGRVDFFSFYRLHRLDAVITDRSATGEQRAEVQQSARLISAGSPAGPASASRRARSRA